MPKEDERVRCPYYKAEQQRQLRCEGLSEGNRLHLCFTGGRGLWEYKQRHCRSRWQSCPIARMLDEKYEEKG